MKKKELIQHPELYQGERYQLKTDHYFEGWYFKHSKDKQSLCLIPGIAIEKENKNAFVQVITEQKSYYVPYDYEQFSYSHSPFYITIGNNYFSKEKTKLDLQFQDLKIEGEIQYHNPLEINKSKLCPNIMGPFSHLPQMECNHAILSMYHTLSGEIIMNDTKIDYQDSIGYIEKDWGKSFPKSYIWCQANNFYEKQTSLFLSIANIPMGKLSFEGFICVLIVEGKEYKFTTYNGAKMQNNSMNDTVTKVKLSQKDVTLEIQICNLNSHLLIAPTKGKMQKPIQESLNSTASVKLKQKNKMIFEGCSTNAGLEIVT